MYILFSFFFFALYTRKISSHKQTFLSTSFLLKLSSLLLLVFLPCTLFLFYSSTLLNSLYLTSTYLATLPPCIPIIAVYCTSRCRGPSTHARIHPWMTVHSSTFSPECFFFSKKINSLMFMCYHNLAYLYLTSFSIFSILYFLFFILPPLTCLVIVFRY